MTAEAFPSTHNDDREAVKLRIVKAGRDLAERAVPAVMDWGPELARERGKHESPTPDGLTYSA